jgi:hypothetical protein
LRGGQKVLDGMCTHCYEKVFGEDFFKDRTIDLSEETCPICKEGKIVAKLVADYEGESINCSHKSAGAHKCGSCGGCGGCGKH